MNYHVFLSFRGPDTRTTFTDHLYAALLRKGIVTFRDKEGIDKGEFIPETLPRAIHQSLFFIVVLSPDYASSPWCLNELHEIVETKEKETVFPVFYGVNPSDVGRQNLKSVADAFDKYKRRYPKQNVQQWKKALSKVAKFSGWEKKDTHEAELVEEIAEFIWGKLCNQLPSNFGYLVGQVKSKVDEITSLLKIGLDDKCFIGIWSMGGAGKTTLVRVVYDAVRKNNFDTSCFLANVREDSERFGLVYLQKKLLTNLKLGEPKIIDSFHGAEIIRTFLRHKKVFIVLDDVSHRSQLDNLARNKEWFGDGSKIIITTRDKHLLTQYEQFVVYKVDMLHHDESLQLLCQKAFKKNEPELNYLDLSRKFIEHASGLPLALEVLGSFLCRRKQSEWRDTLGRLRQNLHEDIFRQLRISYDGLELEEYKTIFLDVACFFNGEAKFKVANILKICGLHEIIGLKVLTEKSFLLFSQLNSSSRENVREHQNMHDRLQKMRRNNDVQTYLYDQLQGEASEEYVYMHNLLQEMGRNIVFQESPRDAGRRSRLWSLQDIDLVLKGNKGMENVQSIVLDIQEGVEATWHPDCFSRMINLRLLDLSNVHLTCNLNSLPGALKFLRWDNYTLESLPSIDQLYELERLQLRNSKIRNLWTGSPPLDKLRIIDVSDSKLLEETPDFSATPNLEELLLNYCKKLARVHESVGQLKKLIKLRLEYCRNLVTLPSNMETNNLEELILGGCLMLEKLPEFGRDMRSLYFLDVKGTGITEIPLSITHLINLKILDYSGCSRLESETIPDLPPNLIKCATNRPWLKLESALPHLCASHVPERPCGLQGPIHHFADFRAGTEILTWFKHWEYCWGKDSSGEFVTITADIPSNVAVSNKECRGIAVCLLLESISQAWQDVHVDWKFQDYLHPKKTEIHGIPTYYTHDCGVYVGFFPFDKEDCRRHPSGEDTQLDLTLSFPTININSNLEIMGCGWHLACKEDFDKWWENNKAPSPSGHGFLIRGERGGCSNSISGRKEDKQENINNLNGQFDSECFQKNELQSSRNFYICILLLIIILGIAAYLYKKIAGGSPTLARLTAANPTLSSSGLDLNLPPT